MSKSHHNRGGGCQGRVIAGVVLAATMGVAGYGQPIVVPPITPPPGVVVGALAEQTARLRGFPLRLKTSTGRAFRLDALIFGRPTYTATTDAAANRTIRTNLVHTRTVSGVTRPFLTGATARAVGVWDEAAVRTTHQEFGGRVRQIDGATELSGASAQSGRASAGKLASKLAPLAHSFQANRTPGMGSSPEGVTSRRGWWAWRRRGGWGVMPAAGRPPARCGRLTGPSIWPRWRWRRRRA